jgi:AcrR family transcriptional regulator
MSPRPRREERHPDLPTAIKDTAWKQIAEFGASAFGLRAIARDLKITAPSIYNYFPSRDHLVTALIVDAFNSLADAQEASIVHLPSDDYPGQLIALGLAYRHWAITYPQRYQLIFGTPIPRYHAPQEITTPAAERALLPLSRVIQGLYSTGRLQLEQLAPMTSRLQSMLKAWQTRQQGTHIEALYLSLILWGRVHGLVMLEIGNQYPPFLEDPSEIFQREIRTFLKSLCKNISI